MNLYKGHYLLGSLSYEEADLLLRLRETESVDTLQDSILNLDSFEVETLIEKGETYLKKNKTLEGFTNTKENYKKGQLQGYQTVGTAFMYYAKKMLLSDEVGLGKTVQASALINTLRIMHNNQGKPFRYLLVTKNPIAQETRRKLVQFTGDFVYLIKSSSSTEVNRFYNRIEDYDESKNLGVVATHQIFSNSDFLLHTNNKPYDLIIIDESREFRNSTLKNTKNAKKILHLHDRVILMNATPIELELRDIYNQLALLELNYMPYVKSFEYDFVKKIPSPRGFGWEIDSYKNSEKFNRMIQLRQFGRTRKELGAVYEDNKFTVLEVPLSEEQKNLQKITTQYQMVYDYPRGIDKNLPYNRETTPKLEFLDKILTQDFEFGKTQALIYCRYRKAQYDLSRFLSAQGYTVKVLNGETDYAERSTISKEYSDGKYDILVTNVLEGLDLGSCNLSIIYSIDPNPQNLVQFEGRMTREFNVRGKNLILLASEGREIRNVKKVLHDRIILSEDFLRESNSLTFNAIKDVVKETDLQRDLKEQSKQQKLKGV